MSQTRNVNSNLCPVGKICFRGFQMTTESIITSNGQFSRTGLILDSNTPIAYVIQGRNSANQFVTDYFVDTLGNVTNRGGITTFHKIRDKVHKYRQRINHLAPNTPPNGTVTGFPFPWEDDFYTDPSLNSPFNGGLDYIIILDTTYSKTPPPETPGFNRAQPASLENLIGRLAICFANRQAQETALIWRRSYVMLDRTNRTLPIEFPTMAYLQFDAAGNRITPAPQSNPFPGNFICMDPQVFHPKYKPHLSIST